MSKDIHQFEKGRIKALQAERIFLQKKTFTKWVNSFLQETKLEIKDLFTDLGNGKILMKLLEILSNEQIGTPNRGIIRVHKLENVGKCLRFLSSKVSFENIGAEDIVDGNPCLILGLIWTIILRFHIKEIKMDDEGKSTANMSAKDTLLLWCQRKTVGYPGVSIQNFTGSWRNGLGFNALIHAHRPDLIDYDVLHPEDHINNLTNAFQVASLELGIPQILDAEDVAMNKPDEKSILTYVASYYHYFANMKMEITEDRQITKGNMEPENCSFCRHEKGVPIQWCSHSLKSLCSLCEEQHRLQSICGDNSTIPYEDYHQLPPFILNVELSCKMHNEKFKYICRSHDVPCCEKCLSFLHKKCDDTPEIDEIIRNVKSSAVFEDVWGELKETKEAYKTAIDTGENNLRQMETKKKEFAKRVKDRTNKLIDQLRTIENQTLSAFDSVVTETAAKIKTANKLLRSQETKLETMLGHKTSIKSHASDFQTFIGIKHIENIVKESQESLHEECNSGDLYELEVDMEEDDTIDDIIFGAISLGNINMHMKKTKLNLKTGQANRAQMMVDRGFPPKLKLSQHFALEYGDYSGCCSLPNELMAFVDFGKDEIKVTGIDGAVNSRVKFFDKIVSDVTIIDINHIAASNPGSQTISIIEIDSGKVIQALQTNSEVSGITHQDGYIYFCVQKEV